MKFGGGGDDRFDDEEKKKRKQGGGSYDPTLKPRFAGRGGGSELSGSDANAYLAETHSKLMPANGRADRSRQNKGDINRSPSIAQGTQRDDEITAIQHRNTTPEGQAEIARGEAARVDAIKPEIQQRIRESMKQRESLGNPYSREAKEKAADLRKMADKSSERVALRLGSREVPAAQQNTNTRQAGKTDLAAMADSSSQKVAQRDEARQSAQMTAVQRLQSMPEGATLTDKKGTTARLEGEKGSQQVVLTDKAGNETRIDAEKAHRNELADRSKRQQSPAISQ